MTKDSSVQLEILIESVLSHGSMHTGMSCDKKMFRLVNEFKLSL